MRDAPTPDDAELRLALGMRGGVSLAVWIGGACAEIDALRRAADEQQGFWWEVLSASPYSRVVVDVMAGASAGGLNGVLFATAIRHGFRMEELAPVWRQVAAIDDLRRRSAPWISLLDGDLKFLDVIRETLDRYVRPSGTDGKAGEEAAAERVGSIDVQLSATLVEPVVRSATSPRDETLRKHRSGARFHFRHDPAAALPRRDLDAGCIPQLAVAARATASFPAAFEPAVVRSRRPETFDSVPAVPVRPVDGVGERLADCHGFFSESRGRRSTEPAPFDADDFVVADGGIVDNIPLGKAIDAIRDAPADGPTRRVLVYLHPTGPAGVAPATAGAGEAVDDQTRRRGLLAMGRGLQLAKLQGESIDGDLERIEQHNSRVRLGVLLRRSLLTDLIAQGASGATELAKARVRSYSFQRGGADAAAVHDLLADPVVVLGEDPFPYLGERPEHEERWRTPLWDWDAQRRQSLDVDLRTELTERLSGGDLCDAFLDRALGPSIRSVRLLIELVRAAERQPGAAPDLGEVKRSLYQLGSLMQSMHRMRCLGWVVAAGHRGEANAAWIDTTLAALDRLLKLTNEEAAAIFDDLGSREGYFRRCDRLLHEWTTTGVGPAEPAAGSVDVRQALVERLQPLVAKVLGGLDAPSAGPAGAGDAEREPSGAEVIQRVLLDVPDGQPPATAAELAERLAALEVLLVNEQLVGNPGASEIGFERMSAAAITVDACRFTELYRHSSALDPGYTDEDHLLPNVKLAGNELGSFSAFLKEEWRTNDWVWGRMDAVPTLVDLVLGLDRRDEQPDVARYQNVAGVAGVAGTAGGVAAEEDVRRALIRRRQDEIFDDAVKPGSGLPADRGKWVAGLEDLTHPGSPSLARSMRDIGDVAGAVVGEALPPTFPRVTPQLRGVLRAVAKRFARPRGGLRPLPGEQAAVVAEPPGRLLLVVASIVGVTVAAAVWAVVANPLAFVVGMVVALVPGAVLLWLALQRRPKGAGRSG